MKPAFAGLIFSAFLFIQAGTSSAPAASPDLLKQIQAAGIGKLSAASASVYQDDRSGCLTMTFHYVQGDAEVKVPIQNVGWPLDWSGFRSITFTMRSTSVEPVFMRFSDGDKINKDVVIEPMPGIEIRGVIPFEEPIPTVNQNVPRLSPIGDKMWPNTLSVPSAVKEISFRMHYPTQPAQVTFCNFTLAKDVPANDIVDRHPVIDRYGQWIPAKWIGKAYSDDDLKKLWATEDLQPEKYPYCPLGGYLGIKLRATGFFRTERTVGRWVLVDPHGHPFYSAGIDLVGAADSSFATEVTGRKYLYEELPQSGPAWLTPDKIVSFYVANLVRRYGDKWEEQGNQHFVERLRNWGFNTIGNWSNAEFAARSGMPYVLPLYGWSTKKSFSYPYGLPDMFSDEFKQNVDEAARRQCSSLKNVPNLIGWFLENEPLWPDKIDLKKPWADIVLDDPEPSATQTKLRQLLAANPKDAAAIKQQFLHLCVQQYLETIISAVRKYDPNHLILGVRFAGRPAPEWIKLASMFDVLSVNIYSDTFAPDPVSIKEYAELSGRPVLIGEFTATASGRGLEGLFYGVHKVRDLAERGVAYRYFVENSAANPDIVGTHWFQFVDDLPTGRPNDVERLNYGFVNVIDLPYEDLVQAARETHHRLYDLMFGNVQPVQTKPLMN
ncbi:MAG: hypothetical protein WA674_01465 [Candidatus Acidiferrales bacterium]